MSMGPYPVIVTLGFPPKLSSSGDREILEIFARADIKQLNRHCARKPQEEASVSLKKVLLRHLPPDLAFLQ